MWFALVKSWYIPSRFAADGGRCSRDCGASYLVACFQSRRRFFVVFSGVSRLEIDRVTSIRWVSGHYPAACLRRGRRLERGKCSGPAGDEVMIMMSDLFGFSSVTETHGHRRASNKKKVAKCKQRSGGRSQPHIKV